MKNDQKEFIPAYGGDDMAAYIMEMGFKLPDYGRDGSIKSITNVWDTAIIVTDWSVWRARPCHQVGFCIELVARM